MRIFNGKDGFRTGSRCLEKYRVLAADASDVSEKGRSGRIYRLHFALDLFHLKASLYNITTNSVGERLRNFDLKENDLIIADRIYATPTGMGRCLERGADFILRVRRGAFTLLDENGKAMELYRFRWQAEIYFKRLKSILDFGELPKKTPESALAWPNGKLMAVLLMEKFMSGKIFSPPDERQPEFVAGNEDAFTPA